MALSKIDVANMLTGLVPNDNTIRRPNSKPLIFNGDMAVSQRNGTTATTIGAEAYSLDRWSFREISNGTTTVAQTTTVPSGKGFAHSAKVAVTGADTSISADNIVAFAQKLEGQDAQVLKYGTSDAEKVTLSFYVKSNITGTYSATLRHTNTSGTAYVNSLTFSISSANTWEQKVLVFNGNTAQDIRNTNTEGIRLEIILTVGTDYTSGGGANANSWTTGNTNRASSSNVNILSSTDNDFFLTGVQMEVGEFSSTTLPPFQHESFEENLSRCQRYFLFTGGGSNYTSHGTGVEASSTSGYCNVPMSTVMRTTPSITKRDTLTMFDGNGESDVTSIGTPHYGKQGTVLQLQLTASGGGLSDNAGLIVYSDNSSTAGFLIDAEL
jgi:hypothetical protein